MALILILIIPIIIIVLYYNNIIRKKNQIENAFSAIDVMLKKRFDLIPNLVEVVKQYANYEQSTLNKIVELRHLAIDTNNTEEKSNYDRQIAQSMREILVQVENYPDLKANQSYLNLQKTWTESEEQIAAARRTFNSNVIEYNNSIMTFPGNVIGGIFSFKRQSPLETPAEERAGVSAKDLFN